MLYLSYKLHVEFLLFLVSIEWESRSLWFGHVPHGWKIKYTFLWHTFCHATRYTHEKIYKKSPTSWHWNENKRQQHLYFLTSRL